ncbi:MAG: restriction endonuclease subunit S [Pseudomonadota bacterium]
MKTKNITIKLNKLADIRSGHSFRNKVQHSPDQWDYYVLQLKDVQKNCHIDLDQATRVKMIKEKTPRTLQQGDILLRARGGYYYSGLFNADIPNVIAAGQFFVLSPNTDIIDPAYLCWYINQPIAQQYLARNDTGSNIPMINKQTISNFPVKLPSLNTQHKIAQIHQNWLKEKRLTEQLLNNREQIMRSMCQQFIEQDFINQTL